MQLIEGGKKQVVHSPSFDGADEKGITPTYWPLSLEETGGARLERREVLADR